jgi:hypothetical protein
MSDHCVVHFEQKSHSVPFIGQLLLGRLDVLKIKRIVNGHGHLSCNLTEEAKVRVLIGSISDTADGHSSQASMRGAQWQTATGPYVIFAQPLHSPREANFVVNVVNEERLLSLPYGTAKRLIDRQLGNQFPGGGLLQNAYAHDIALRVMQPHAQVVEAKNMAKLLSEIMKQLVQISMCGNGLGNIEERLVLFVLKVRFGRSHGRLFHGVKHIHRAEAVQVRNCHLTKRRCFDRFATGCHGSFPPNSRVRVFVFRQSSSRSSPSGVAAMM